MNKHNARMKTKSEDLFENLCAAKKIIFNRIEGETQTPDYLACIDGIEFIAEVKQIDPNDEQKKLLAEFEKKTIIQRQMPGEKVRSKIKSAATQISKLAKGKMPGMLVLYNNLPFALGNPLSPYDIRVEMFGLETIVLTKPEDFSASKVIDKRFGPKRKVTEEHNTSLSALAIINDKYPNQLDIYHNHHAAIPFKRGVFQKFGNKEYELEEKQPVKFQEWKEV